MLKSKIEIKLSGEVLLPEQICDLSRQLSHINSEIDIKSDRWLYLAEIVEQ